MNKKGQNVVEYVLLVAATVIIFIFFLSPYSPFKASVEKNIFNGTVKKMKDVAGEIKF